MSAETLHVITWTALALAYLMQLIALVFFTRERRLAASIIVIVSSAEESEPDTADKYTSPSKVEEEA